MLEFLLNLPAMLGCLIVMAVFVVGGLAIAAVSQRVLFRDKEDELRDATRTIFLAVNLLVGLFLSLSLTSVVGTLNDIRDEVEREAVAISDVYHGLQLIDAPAAREIQRDMIEYTQALIEEDWPSLATDSLADRPLALLRDIWNAAAELAGDESIVEFYLAGIRADLDALSNYRFARLHHALAPPPVFLLVVVFGMVVVMLCLGLYQPSRTLIVLVSAYLAFAGLIVYLILALSDPFQGALGVDPVSLEYVLADMMRDGGSKP